jgi:hypothetical protein
MKDAGAGVAARNTRGAIACGTSDCVAGRDVCVDGPQEWLCVSRDQARQASTLYACDDGTDCPQGETCCLSFASALASYACSKRRGPGSDCRVEICAEGGARCPKGQVCQDGVCASPDRAATCGAAGRCTKDRPFCRWSEKSVRCTTYAEFSKEESEEPRALLTCTRPSDCGAESRCCTNGIWDGTQCLTNCDTANNAQVCSADADCTKLGSESRKGKCKTDPEATRLPPWLKLCAFD